MSAAHPLAAFYEPHRQDPWRRPDAARVDRAHPAAQRLELAILFDATQPPHDLVLASRSIAAVDQRLAADIVGLTTQATGALGRYELSPVVSFPAADWTLSSLVRFPIDNNADAVLAANNSPYAFHVLRVGASDALGSWSGSYVSFSPAVAPLSLAGWRRITAVGDAGGVRLHLDGQAVGAHATPITAGIRYILGDGDGGGLTRAFGAAADFFIWSRALSDTEVRAHARAPYAMLRGNVAPSVRSSAVVPAILPPFRRAEPNTLLRM